MPQDNRADEPRGGLDPRVVQFQAAMDRLATAMAESPERVDLSKHELFVLSMTAKAGAYALMAFSANASVDIQQRGRLKELFFAHMGTMQGEECKLAATALAIIENRFDDMFADDDGDEEAAS